MRGYYGRDCSAYLKEKERKVLAICKQCSGYKKTNVGEICYTCRNKNTNEKRRKKMEDAKVNTTEDNEPTYIPIYLFMITGVQHHRIKDVLANLEEGTVLALITEPTNKFDPNAIRIEHVAIGGEMTMLGYVPKKFSAEVSAKITVGRNLECTLIKLNKLAKPWEMAMVEIREITDRDQSMKEVHKKNYGPEGDANA
jgi:hypothetical protein